MANGGYKIIDLKGTSLSTTAKTIEGVYAGIGSTKKPIMLCNINIGGTAYHDTIINITVSSSKYVWTVYGYNFEVTNQDKVKATAVS